MPASAAETEEALPVNRRLGLKREVLVALDTDELRHVGGGTVQEVQRLLDSLARCDSWACLTGGCPTSQFTRYCL